MRTKAKADEGVRAGPSVFEALDGAPATGPPPEAKSEEELFQWLTALLNGHPELSRVPKAQETSLQGRGEDVSAAGYIQSCG